MLDQTYAEFVATQFHLSSFDDAEVFGEVFKLVGERVGLVYGHDVPIGREFMLQGQLLRRLAEESFVGRLRREEDTMEEVDCHKVHMSGGGYLVLRNKICVSLA